MSYQPIENYGVIGNMRTTAHVGMNGSIDWYCYPFFDSPSIFGAILDDKKGGFFQIHPVSEKVTYRQVYWPDTNILVTRFLQTEGIVEVTDFMPAGLPEGSPWYHRIVRMLKCVRGTVRIRLTCMPAFNYGRTEHTLDIVKNGAVFRTGDLNLFLSTKIPLERMNQNGVQAEFTLKENEQETLIFKPDEDNEERTVCPDEKEAQQIFQETVKFWHHWLSASTYRGRWRQQVNRSALALKLMTFEPTGAIIAAPTASLPEVVGGSRNWDYRYTWIRDAAFVMYALLRIGFKTEAAGFMRWVREFADFVPNKPAPTVFQIHGGSDLPEYTLDHWEGYKKSGPVRIGNQASQQFQNDLYGEFFDGLYLYNKYVQPLNYDMWTKMRERLNWICENWQLPDEGIWEMRGSPKQFVYSKVMNWVALDRGIRLAEKRSLPSDKEKWTKVRDQIYEEVMEKGWNEKLQTFTQAYGSDNLDASLLIMPLVFFIAPNDTRMLKTIQKINRSPKEGGLVADGLVYRYTPGSHVDGLEGMEGTFNMCSFWLVEAMTRAGRTEPEYLDQARLLFERMLRYNNHLGLYAEQTGLQGEGLGNFPQAFTHLALISAAFNLDRELGNRS